MISMIFSLQSNAHHFSRWNIYYFSNYLLTAWWIPCCDFWMIVRLDVIDEMGKMTEVMLV